MLPRPRIEKRRALHKPPLTGYVSIGLLKMILGHTRLDALLDMTAETRHWGLSNPRFAAR
jgi:hypothetical protein